MGMAPPAQALGGAQASVSDLIKTSPPHSPADDDGDSDGGGTPVQHADSDP